MSPTHRMTIEASNGNEVLFTCHEAGCGRRVILQRSGGMVVLDRGDFFALHSGGTPGVDLTPSAAA